MNLRNRDFLTLLDYTSEEIRYILDLAYDFKTKKREKKKHDYLKGKNIALLFEKNLIETRGTFEVAAYDLGMNVSYLGPVSSQISKKESIEDTVRVLCRMYDGIEYCGLSQEIIEELAKISTVPIWNGLTSKYQPIQILADLMTMEEHFKKLKGLNVVFIGNGHSNITNSLMIACSKMGLNFTCCSPKELWPDKDLVGKCREIAFENSCSVTLTDNVKLGSMNQDVVYTDVWVSMEESDELWDNRIKLLRKYQVNKKVIDNMKSNCIFLHCLPSFHNLNISVEQDIYNKFKLTEMEVTNDVFESNYSRVFEEAENRMHIIKAIIYATLRDKNE